MQKKEKENIREIELRSEEFQEILGHVPHWIIRWGILVIFISVGILVAGSWIFKYPDIKRAPIIVTTENPPATLVAKVNGKIEKLFAGDNDSVVKDQHLALIENPADYGDVMDLKKKMNLFTRCLPDFRSPDTLSFEKGYRLGEIQSVYAGFLKRFQDYINFIHLDYHEQKIRSLEKEIQKYNLYLQRLRQQSRILAREMELTSRQYQRDSVLYKQGVIPQADYERSQSAMLQKEYDHEQSRVGLSAVGIEVARLEQQMLDLELKKEEEEKQLQAGLLEAYDKLMASISIWEQQYLLKAPISGILSFTKFWSENQNVRAGDRVMTVIPSRPGEIIGKINLSIEGSGKVENGQKVNIKFANYPHMEYGMVRGIVKSISLVPDDNEYSVEVALPEGLVTYYGIEIGFNQEMQGQAEILTDERRLLERVISPLRSLISKQVMS